MRLHWTTFDIGRERLGDHGWRPLYRVGVDIHWCAPDLMFAGPGYSSVWFEDEAPENPEGDPERYVVLV